MKKSVERETPVPAQPSSGKMLGWLLPVAGSLLTGLLLALSFPGHNQASLAFIGLVPLLFAVQGASAKKAAVLGLLSGFVFFMSQSNFAFLHFNFTFKT